LLRICWNISWSWQLESAEFGGVHHLQPHLLQVSSVPCSSPVKHIGHW
jgi:hypothetical protein